MIQPIETRRRAAIILLYAVARSKAIKAKQAALAMDCKKTVRGKAAAKKVATLMGSTGKISPSSSGENTFKYTTTEFSPLLSDASGSGGHPWLTNTNNNDTNLIDPFSLNQYSPLPNDKLIVNYSTNGTMGANYYFISNDTNTNFVLGGYYGPDTNYRFTFGDTNGYTNTNAFYPAVDTSQTNFASLFTRNPGQIAFPDRPWTGEHLVLQINGRGDVPLPYMHPLYPSQGSNMTGQLAHYVQNNTNGLWTTGCMGFTNNFDYITNKLSSLPSNYNAPIIYIPK